MSVYLNNVPKFKEKYKNELKKKKAVNENQSQFKILELGSTRSNTSELDSCISDT